MKKIITEIEQKMLGILDNAQMEHLHKVLVYYLESEDILVQEEVSNVKILEMFLSAKKIEGFTEKSILYYQSRRQNMFKHIEKTIKHIDTNDLREYLSNYQEKGNAGKVTIDNIRRILSSFFSWLEEENYILKSPVRRIKKVKTGQVIKETYSDESLEMLRDFSGNIRDLAMIDLLSSTGMRVGELVKLNISDVDFENRECVVLGKGDKERRVYFDARTKIHLARYIKSRNDDNEALFVSLLKPHSRLKISGVEIRLRELGRKLNIPKVHPHKFRRTLATRAIDKGMPIEQVQKLLGHTKIDTTLQYAMVNQSNVKNSHRKYIG